MWCEKTEKQNGQVVNTADRTWSPMAGLLKGCTYAIAREPGGAERSGRSQHDSRHSIPRT